MFTNGIHIWEKIYIYKNIITFHIKILVKIYSLKIIVCFLAIYIYIYIYIATKLFIIIHTVSSIIYQCIQDMFNMFIFKCIFSFKNIYIYIFNAHFLI